MKFSCNKIVHILVITCKHKRKPGDTCIHGCFHSLVLPLSNVERKVEVCLVLIRDFKENARALGGGVGVLDKLDERVVAELLLCGYFGTRE